MSNFIKNPISMPYLFVQHYDMGEISKINTPFLVHDYGIPVKDSILKNHFPNFSHSKIIIPNLFYDIKEGISITFPHLEFFLKSIYKSNDYFLCENNDFFNLNEFNVFKKRLKIQETPNPRYTEDKDEYIMLHINALRLLDCIFYFIKRSKKNEKTDAFLKNTKYMIIFNLKCSNLIDRQKEVEYKEVLY